MVTLLQATNKVLSMVGEVEVATITQPKGASASGSVILATQALQQEADWLWLREMPTPSWNGRTATISRLKNIHSVSYASSVVRNLSLDDFLTCVSRNLNTDEKVSYWTRFTDTDILVWPTPPDSTTRAKVQIVCYRYKVSPSIAADTIPVPDDFLEAVYEKAASLLCSELLGNEGASSAHLMKYVTIVQKQKQAYFRQSKTPQTAYGGMNYGTRF